MKIGGRGMLICVLFPPPASVILLGSFFLPFFPALFVFFLPVRFLCFVFSYLPLLIVPSFLQKLFVDYSSSVRTSNFFLMTTNVCAADRFILR